MGISLAVFESSPIPPPPTAPEFQALAALGSQAAKTDRVALMNSIGGIMGIPPSGWSGGQSRLFEQGDVRMVWLLRRLAREGLAKAVAKNADRVTKFVDADIMLTLTTAARESDASIGAVSSAPIDSFYEGGLDYLWDQKGKLGLPTSVTSTWTEIKPFKNPESNHIVHPAMIPARDQVLAYAAQMTSSYRNNVNHHDQWIRSKGKAGSTACRVATLIWKAYAFLAQGGSEYDPSKTFDSQRGQKFGVFKALTYVTLAPALPALGPHYLNRILVDTQLNTVEWVRIAKARVAEALYLEHLLREARKAMVPGP